MTETDAENTSPLLAVLLNEELQLRYDRNTALPAHQLQYLERMDQRMSEGIRLDGDWIEQPDPLQRANFVAIHLVEAMQQGNDASVAASCAYLAQRLPELKQVKAKVLGAGTVIELVFDQPYVEEVPVNFLPRTPAE